MVRATLNGGVFLSTRPVTMTSDQVITGESVFMKAMAESQRQQVADAFLDLRVFQRSDFTGTSSNPALSDDLSTQESEREVRRERAGGRRKMRGRRAARRRARTTHRTEDENEDRSRIEADTRIGRV